MAAGRFAKGSLAAVVAVLALCAAACVTAVNGPGGGPVTHDLELSVELAGGYQYSTVGVVSGGDLDLDRSGGSLVALTGTAEVPGRGAQPAEVTFDVSIEGDGIAQGSITVVDPAAGLRAVTELSGGTVTVGDGSVGGRSEWQRLWTVLSTQNYVLNWSLADTTAAVSPTPIEPAAEVVRAITYNVAGLPEPLSGSSPTRNSRPIGEKLNGYDLALLQEDFFYADVLARDLTHTWGSPPDVIPLGSDPRRGSALVGTGLERYARHRISYTERVPWVGCFGELPTDGGASDCLSLKGFSLATHTIAGVEVDVYNLHAEAGATPYDQYWSERDYEQLAAYISENSAGRAILLGGDTNLHTDEPADAAIWSDFLAATGLADACTALDCTEDPFTIDRWAFRSGDDVSIEALGWDKPDEFVTAGGEALSDHLPTSFDFKVQAAGSPT